MAPNSPWKQINVLVSNVKKICFSFKFIPCTGPMSVPQYRNPPLIGVIPLKPPLLGEVFERSSPILGAGFQTILNRVLISGRNSTQTSPKLGEGSNTLPYF